MLTFIDQGREVQLSAMARNSGAGFGSNLIYGSGFFHMRIKLPNKKTAGVVTAFYGADVDDEKKTDNDESFCPKKNPIPNEAPPLKGEKKKKIEAFESNGENMKMDFQTAAHAIKSIIPKIHRLPLVEDLVIRLENFALGNWDMLELRVGDGEEEDGIKFTTFAVAEGKNVEAFPRQDAVAEFPMLSIAGNITVVESHYKFRFPGSSPYPCRQSAKRVLSPHLIAIDKPHRNSSRHAEIGCPWPHHQRFFISPPPQIVNVMGRHAQRFLNHMKTAEAPPHVNRAGPKIVVQPPPAPSNSVEIETEDGSVAFA
ncbi:xyloglucan endotransglucosylase/hydrolase [Striga asiatica]|uniref:Xyloglucan endotransglucosylase/hydrolase n=1 Tax=Striga asiatica TaxID=4170 RepID=A0A5A7QZ07_STRAF|nr:xyloglucan endotransglucosylase/hydrolase [Striga asiatica]